MWTEEKEQRAIELCRAGFSSSQIGAEIGKTRNAVIGKLHRLKRAGVQLPVFSKAMAAQRQRRKVVTTRKPKPRAKAKKTLRPDPAKVEEILVKKHFDPIMLGKTFEKLGHGECRFAFTEVEPGDGDKHLFCGLEVKAGSKFCKHHHPRVYTSPRGFAQRDVKLPRVEVG